MNVVNLSKNTTLSNNLKEASSFFDKVLGLLKKSNPRALLFKTRFGIHTFGLKEPIDVIVLDNNYKVNKVAAVSPNRLFFWNPRHFLILELPFESIKKTKTEVGDVIRLN